MHQRRKQKAAQSRVVRNIYRNMAVPAKTGYPTVYLSAVRGSQGVYLAMALAQDTRTIFMDEPTTYLDISHQFRLIFLNIPFCQNTDGKFPFRGFFRREESQYFRIPVFLFAQNIV